jgi:hypothetical protein
MTAIPAVTAQDLELEHGELLPARETLYLPPINPGGPMRGYPLPPVGSCPPLPHAGALAEPNLVACPM